jgi:hypothetical protein
MKSTISLTLLLLVRARDIRKRHVLLSPMVHPGADFAEVLICLPRPARGS